MCRQRECPDVTECVTEWVHLVTSHLLIHNLSTSKLICKQFHAMINFKAKKKSLGWNLFGTVKAISNSSHLNCIVRLFCYIVLYSIKCEWKKRSCVIWPALWWICLPPHLPASLVDTGLDVVHQCNKASILITCKTDRCHWVHYLKHKITTYMYTIIRIIISNTVVTH